MLDEKGNPCYKLYSQDGSFELIPAVNDGWAKEIVYDTLIKNNMTGKIEAQTIRFRRERFICLSCKSADNILLKLMKVPFMADTVIKGTGVMSRCWKHDITSGPASTMDHGETLSVREVTKEEAWNIIKTTGQHPPDWLQP